MATLKINSHIEISTKLSKRNILARVSIYGFIECGRIMSYLNYACNHEALGTPALRYIYHEVADCLKNNVPKMECYGKNEPLYYFKDLNSLKEELEFVISICLE